MVLISGRKEGILGKGRNVKYAEPHPNMVRIGPVDEENQHADRLRRADLTEPSCIVYFLKTCENVQ